MPVKRAYAKDSTTWGKLADWLRDNFADSAATLGQQQPIKH